VRPASLLLTVAACGRLDFETHNAVDATILDGVAAPVSCGSNVLLDDPFDDTVAAPLFMAYTQTGMTTDETAGAVSFVFSPSVGAGRYSGYETTTLYSSQEMCATVELTEVPSSEGLGYFNIVGGTEKIEFIVYRGNLELRTVTTATPASIGVLPFDPIAHRFWRLRQQGGVTHWDVSADGAPFFMLASTTFFTQTTARTAVGAGGVSTTTNGGRFTVERMLITQP
jgi:hypothetical protein